MESLGFHKLIAKDWHHIPYLVDVAIDGPFMDLIIKSASQCRYTESISGMHQQVADLGYVLELCH